MLQALGKILVTVGLVCTTGYLWYVLVLASLDTRIETLERRVDWLESEVLRHRRETGDL